MTGGVEHGASIEALLKQHRELVEAERESKASSDALLDEQRKLTLLEMRRVANIEELLSRVGELIQAVTQQNKLVTKLLSQQPVSSAIAELTDEVQVGMEHIDDSLRLLLEVNRALLMSTPKRVEDRDQLVEALKRATNGESIRRQLERHHRRLNRLKEQMAGFGGSLAPASLTIEIEDTEQEIEALEKKLRGIG
ncbi:MAG: hypothetical protein KDJ65_01620 [Anaerolineae bacterium]|nr:hypothetical protein [Anaerolineae bacterium]